MVFAHAAFLALAGCTPAPIASSEGNAGAIPSRDCTPHFPDKDGWLGADSAYSIERPDGATIWFFGDTFYSPSPTDSLADASFLSNSVAISRCSDNDFEITYSAGGTELAPRDFFRTKNFGFTYWPLAPFWSDGSLFIFLERVVRDEDAGPFDFAIEGVDLARIVNPNAPPRDWSVEYMPVYRGDRVIPGIAAVATDHFVFIYGVRHEPNSAKRDVVMFRLRRADLRKQGTPPALSTYGEGGFWYDGVNLDTAAVLMQNGPTEMSLRFHEGLGRWLAVMPAAEAFADTAFFRTSPTLSGPWTKPKPLPAYVQLGAPEAPSSRRFCYAAKEHAQFTAARSQNILITFVCNSLASGDLDTHKIYRPLSMRVHVAKD